MTEGVSREAVRKKDLAKLQLHSPWCPLPPPPPCLHRVISFGHTLAMAGPALVQAVEGQTGECAAQHPRKNSNFFFLYRWENREILKDNDVTVCGE